MGSGSSIQTDRFGNAGRRIADDPAGAGVITGPVTELVEKLKNLEKNLSDEHGQFRLFGLFLRENSPDKWDVVVAAPWLSKLRIDPIAFISERLKQSLGRSGLMMLSRVVTLSETDRFLVAANEAVQVKHGLRSLADVDLGGVQISRGYVITSSGRPGKRITDKDLSKIQ